MKVLGKMVWGTAWPYQHMEPKIIVINTFGSLGDLHPYLAIALGLTARGHRVKIATGEAYRTKVESEGIGFHAVRPNISPDDTEAIRLAMDAKKGSEYVLRQMFLPHLRSSYEDLTEAVAGADLLVTHPLTYAGPLVAVKTGIRWVSSVLAPISFLSACDPSVLSPAPWLATVGRLLPSVNRFICALGKRVTVPWGEPVRNLRREIGLPPGANPIFEGQHSPGLVLALFSKLLAAPQPDWPPNTHVTGFAFYDRLEKRLGLAPELAQFLDSGPAPIVFTLGTSAVMAARDFYRQSAAAAGQLGRRAVLLIGRDPANLPAAPLPPGAIAAEYAPYSEIFPRAGRPMLVVPFSHDQPDNAARVVRSGVARQISPTGYRADRVANELRKLLDNPSYTTRSAQVAEQIRSEDGVSMACDLIEQRLV